MKRQLLSVLCRPRERNAKPMFYQHGLRVRLTIWIYLWFERSLREGSVKKLYFSVKGFKHNNETRLINT